MVNDKNKEIVMEYLSRVLNTGYNCETLGHMFERLPLGEGIPEEYLNYFAAGFIFYYRLDCLYEKGLITEEIKGKIIKLYKVWGKLNTEFDSLVIKQMYKETEEEKEEIAKEMGKTYSEMKEAEALLNNFHLLEEINLGELIEKSVKVDNNNVDLDFIIAKIK